MEAAVERYDDAGRAPEGLIRSGALVSVAVAALGLVLLLGGCGGADASPEGFGAPPSSAPGVRAWACGEVGTVLATADGGATWKRQRFYLSESGVDVAFCDARTGWLVTDAGSVLRTVDAGASWKVVKKCRLQFKALAAASRSTACAVAVDGAAGDLGEALVMRTTDGGQTWARSRFGEAQLVDIAFADARRGVLVALDSIWTTRDGGRSWRLRERLGMSVLASVVTGDVEHAWVAGWDTRDGQPFVVTTADAGASWRRMRVDVAASAPGILQPGQLAAAGGVMAGQNDDRTRLWITCAAGVLASRDGGKNWRLHKVAAGQPSALAAADERHLLATTTGQPILASRDGGETWAAFGHEGFLARPLVGVAAVAPAAP